VTSAIIYGLDAQAYRDDDALSYSESKLLQRSPLHLKWWRDHPELRGSSSPAQAFGTMVHTAVLEPSTFDHRYAVGPTVNKNTKEWKEFTAYCADEMILPTTAEDRVAAFTCAENVRAHPVVGPLLADGNAEVSVFWTDSRGVRRKARLDWVKCSGRFAMPLDLKTTQDASRAAFTRSVVNFQYHRQAQWYETGYAAASGLEVSPMLFVVVESAPPYACVAYTLDRWFYAQAARINADLLDLYRHCVKHNDWPGYDTSITDLTAPRFALDEELRELQREEEAYS
jgi:hypothetical protein